MKADWKEAAFTSVLTMTESRGELLNLVTFAQPFGAAMNETISSDDLANAVERATGQNDFLSRLGMQVHKWDVADESQPWTQTTSRSSPERRNLICALLGLNDRGAAELKKKRPIFHDVTVVITKEWSRWYTAKRAHEHAFYWPHYRDYLLRVRKWEQENVTALDIASTDVLERLADPTRAEAYQSKGLVVGYVQSGKTANFTGVVAKSIDAGYRLVIVMTGTIEMLRSQTQRRIDKEMVGRQNIVSDFTREQAARIVDYQDDADWIENKFLDFGPGELVTGIRRLTQHKKDYQMQFKTLRIDRVDMGRPLYDPENLFRAAARLVIVKKNAGVLRKLVSDIQHNRTAFAEIPVLIIDDESDLASVNTVNPDVIRRAKNEGKKITERRAINEQIAKMLTLMPRAQYVGYTATPFANVFVDPSDEQGIFPRDFVIGLNRPPGYMGVEDFHDLKEQGTDLKTTFANSNKKAFVRPLEASEDEPKKQDIELTKAIDMFVLTGAIKRYRKSINSSLDFRHHTMLIHDSVRTDEHRQTAKRVQDLWNLAQFTKPSGKLRLKELYEKDILPVTAVRGDGGSEIDLSPPFETVARFIGETIAQISVSSGNPIIVVNSDKDIQANQQALDFDRDGTWRILVGGAKLSRGFTVEGLTVTYFRRATNMSDSLTQMGRWFGFRQGYRDLVRLYIATRAKFSGREIDIYDAFENVARDEAAFREQLGKYAKWDGDKPRLVPSQIPPLVYQHLPWLKPTARNKMFNAVLYEQLVQPFTANGYPEEPAGLKSNVNTWRKVLGDAKEELTLPFVKTHGEFSAFVGVVSAEAIVAAMANSKYIYGYRDHSVMPIITYYKRLMAEGLLSDFLVILPQPVTEDKASIKEVGARAVVSRERRNGRGGKFGEMTDPKHRGAVVDFIEHGSSGCDPLRRFRTNTRGAVLIYLAKEPERIAALSRLCQSQAADGDEELVVAYSTYVPAAAIPAIQSDVRFTVRDHSKEGDPIVDAQ